jgi:hypothetical protein
MMGSGFGNIHPSFFLRGQEELLPVFFLVGGEGFELVALGGDQVGENEKTSDVHENSDLFDSSYA